MLTLTVKHNYICFLIYRSLQQQHVSALYVGPSSGCGWTYSLGYTSMRVVVLGHNAAGSRSHYVTGYHGPECIWLDIVLFPIGIISYARGV